MKKAKLLHKKYLMFREKTHLSRHQKDGNFHPSPVSVEVPLAQIPELEHWTSIPGEYQQSSHQFWAGGDISDLGWLETKGDITDSKVVKWPYVEPIRSYRSRDNGIMLGSPKRCMFMPQTLFIFDIKLCCFDLICH